MGINVTVTKPVQISSGGGNAPTHCRNFTGGYNNNTGNLEFRWEDYDCDFWGGVVLVVKERVFPKNETDGIIVCDSVIINQYKDTPCTWKPEKETTYCAALFPYSSNLSYNRICASTLRIKVENFAPFADATWEEISTVCEAGKAKYAYNLGDTKPLEVSYGGNSCTVTMRIMDFDRYPLFADTSKTAGIVLLSDELPTFTISSSVGGYYSAGGLLSNIQNISVPVGVNIKEVCGRNMTSPYDIVPTLSRKMMLPSQPELDVNINSAQGFKYLSGKDKSIITKSVVGGSADSKYTYYINMSSSSSSGQSIGTVTTSGSFSTSSANTQQRSPIMFCI